MVAMDDRLAAYLALVAAYPRFFVNPPGGMIEILLDPAEIAAAEAAVAARTVRRGFPENWARVGVLNQDQYGTLLRDAVRFTATGEYGTYHRYLRLASGPPGVAVLPLYRGEVVLVHHFRHATRGWHWEIPRGFGETGGDGEADARRELAEEVQGIASHVTPLGRFYVDAAFIDDPIALFFAELSALGAGEAAEGIATVLTVPVAEFERKIANGEIDDGFTLAAFARARARGLL